MVKAKRKQKEANLGNAETVQPKVIIVDDDPIVNSLAVILLRKVVPDWEVLSFKDGQAFCDHFAAGGDQASEAEAERYLVLLDLSMPRMDGHAVLKCLEANDMGKYFKVAIFTSSVNEDDRLSTEAYDFVFDYIEKPLKRENLSLTLQRFYTILAKN